MLPVTPEQHAVLFPKLNHTHIVEMRRKGIVRQTTRSEILFDRETQRPGVFIVLSGSIAIVGAASGEEAVLSVLGPGEFTGELTRN